MNVMKTKISIIAISILTAPASSYAQSINYDELATLFDEPVTMSATGKPQRASEVPATMEIITQDQIQRSPATDIPGLLRGLAGVDVYATSQNGSDVSIRGYNSPMSGRVLVLVDGRQIYNDSFGFVSWGLVPVELDEIRQIEIVKGPQSALYGFNAASGVINIITFDPLDTPVNSARLSAGTQQQRGISGVSTIKGGRAAARVSVSGFDSQGAVTNYTWFGTDMKAMAPRRRSAHGDGEVQFDDGSRARFEISEVMGRERRLNSGMLTDLFQEVTAVKGEYTIDTSYGIVTARAYHNQFITQVRIPDLSVDSPLRNTATVANISDLFKIGAYNSFRIAGEYRRDESTVVGNYDGALRYTVLSGSAMLDSRLSDTVSLTNAIRFDSLTLGRSGPISAASGLTNNSFNRKINETSFNSGLVWRTTPNDTLRVTAARGLNLPSLYNLGAFEANSFTTRPDGNFHFDLVYGSPAVSPTVVYNYELGWDHTIRSAKAKTRASVFYQQNRDMIAYAPSFVLSAGTALLPFINYGNSDTAGVELGITGKLAPRWDWGLNYTFQIISDSYTSDDRFPQEGNNRRTPAHKANAHLGYAEDSWDFGLDLHYVSNYQMPDITSEKTTNTRGMANLGNYIMLEPRIGYHITPGITAALTAQGMWSRREMTVNPVKPSALASIIIRW